MKDDHDQEGAYLRLIIFCLSNTCAVDDVSMGTFIFDITTVPFLLPRVLRVQLTVCGACVVYISPVTHSVISFIWLFLLLHFQSICCIVFTSEYVLKMECIYHNVSDIEWWHHRVPMHFGGSSRLPSFLTVIPSLRG